MLDPEARAALAEIARVDEALIPGRPGFDLIRTRREHRAQGRVLNASTAVPVARVLELDADGVPCRLFGPGGRAPVVIYVHGGGWALGSPEECEPFCRRLTLHSGWATLAPDYRLAPEHPYPAALEDIERVLAWLRERGEDLGLDTSSVALAGDSAGANLAAAVALRARDRGEGHIVLQALLCPALDLSGDFPSRRLFADGFGLEPESMSWSAAAYTPDPEVRVRPDVSPLRATSLAGLPPALIATAEHDPLRDEGEAYAARLAEAGNAVTATRHLGAIHFFTDPTRFSAADALVDQVAGALRRTSLRGHAGVVGGSGPRVDRGRRLR
jgi:acetyl esterase